MATRTDLINAVLQEIGVLEPGETPKAADTALVGNRCDWLHEMLREKSLVYWTTDDIPEEAMEPLIEMTAARVARAFLRPDAGIWNYESGEQQLRRVVAKQWSGEPVPALYF